MKQETFCVSRCLSSRGLHSPEEGLMGCHSLALRSYFDKKMVYGSSGISGTFYGAALLGSFKPMYLAWSDFFLYHSQFLVFLFLFFSWCSLLLVLDATTCMYLHLDDLCFFFETSLPTFYPATFLAWCCPLLLNAIPGKAREKEQAHSSGGCC